MTQNTIDFHKPLPTPSPLWFYASAALIALCWGLAAYALHVVGIL